MSTIACDTLTSRLIKPEEIFARLDPAQSGARIGKTDVANCTANHARCNESLSTWFMGKHS
jgi:hypothetical protein